MKCGANASYCICGVDVFGTTQGQRLRQNVSKIMPKAATLLLATTFPKTQNVWKIEPPANATQEHWEHKCIVSTELYVTDMNLQRFCVKLGGILSVFSFTVLCFDFNTLMVKVLRIIVSFAMQKRQFVTLQ